MLLVEAEGGLEDQWGHESEEDHRRAQPQMRQDRHQADEDAERREQHRVGKRQAPGPAQISIVMPSRAAFTSTPVDSVNLAASSQGWARHIVIPKWVRIASRGRARRMIASASSRQR